MDLASNPLFQLPGPVLLLIIAWNMVWKGMAMWRAARLKDKTWFVVLLLVNTMGILDILYLQFFSKRPKN
jgi:hypothetical protein